jgi:Fe-S protein assembly co-chaperone HscB
MKKESVAVENLLPFSIVCEKCSKSIDVVLDSFLCSNCGCLNSINSIDYFSYLKLPVSININLDNLETNYLLLMTVYHPDKYSKNNEYYSQAIQHSSFLNNAYNILKDSLLMLGYYYFLHYNKHLLEEGKMLYNNVLNIEFLEYYEMIDEADKTTLFTILEDFQKKHQDILAIFHTIDIKTNPELFEENYIHLKYIVRLIEFCQNKIGKL